MRGNGDDITLQQIDSRRRVKAYQTAGEVNRMAKLLTVTDLHLGIGPSRNFNHHVECSLLGVSVQWNVVERRNEAPGFVCCSHNDYYTRHHQHSVRLINGQQPFDAVKT